MITVVAWLWGSHFSAEYANKLRRMVERHLYLPHHFVVVAAAEWRDKGLDKEVQVKYPPIEFREAPNCIRRMKMYDPQFAWSLGKDVLMLDVDIVIVDNITDMIKAPLQAGSDLALWRVGYPNHNRIYAGGIVLQRSGALTNMWTNFLADPLSFGTRALKHTYDRSPGEGWGAISDQAMLNYWLSRHPVPKQWEWTNEIQPYSERMTVVPPGTKIVTIGHENIESFQQHAWAKEHWR